MIYVLAQSVFKIAIGSFKSSNLDNSVLQFQNGNRKSQILSRDNILYAEISHFILLEYFLSIVSVNVI